MFESRTVAGARDFDSEITPASLEAFGGKIGRLRAIAIETEDLEDDGDGGLGGGVVRETHVYRDSLALAFNGMRVLDLDIAEFTGEHLCAGDVGFFVEFPGFFLLWGSRYWEACDAVEGCGAEVESADL